MERLTAQIKDRILKPLYRKAKHSWRFKGRFDLINRSQNSDRLAIVVAGYKEYLWHLTLPRIAKFASPEIDVCVVSPGLFSQRLNDICSQNGWSYLSTKANKLALAQNIAIAKHPKAQWIFKFDEDIFIAKNYFESMLNGYDAIRKEGLFDPGFVAPIINVNGFSYIEFLKKKSRCLEYKKLFGELKHACMGIKAHYDGQAAKYLWDISLPFDENAELISKSEFAYSVVPHRFSIGAFLMERSIWEKIEGFKVAYRGLLGAEEEHFCSKCVGMSKVMIVLKNVFAGHFSFGPQEHLMKTFLHEIEKGAQLKAG